MVINQDYNNAYNATVGMIAKLVRQYIESGELRDRFYAFDKDAVEWGKGYAIDVILSATKQNDGSTKADEHGKYNPNAMTLLFNVETGGQYAVTLSTMQVKECVGNAEKQQEYAAAIVESLYQGWTDDKNTAVATELVKLVNLTSGSPVSVTRGDDTDKYAADVLTQVKAAVENLREGVTGTEYGNTTVAEKRVAARDVVIVMSNDLAALLDVHGYAKAFGERYLEIAGITRITSSRIPAGTVLITDARNVQVRKKYEAFEEFRNSDGSVNFFYNRYEYIEAAQNGTFAAFPYKVVKTIGG